MFERDDAHTADYGQRLHRAYLCTCRRRTRESSTRHERHLRSELRTGQRGPSPPPPLRRRAPSWRPCPSRPSWPPPRSSSWPAYRSPCADELLLGGLAPPGLLGRHRVLLLGQRIVARVLA